MRTVPHIHNISALPSIEKLGDGEVRCSSPCASSAGRSARRVERRAALIGRVSVRTQTLGRRSVARAHGISLNWNDDDPYRAASTLSRNEI